MRWLQSLALGTGLLTCSGCSLIARDVALAHIRCGVRRAPEITDRTPSLGESRRTETFVFFASAHGPYPVESTLCYLPHELLFHQITGLGRHTDEDLEVTGAHCDEVWSRGTRLPAGRPKETTCRRPFGTAATLSVRTRWGECAIELAPGQPVRRQIWGTYQGRSAEERADR